MIRKKRRGCAIVPVRGRDLNLVIAPSLGSFKSPVPLCKQASGPGRGTCGCIVRQNIPFTGIEPFARTLYLSEKVPA
jgi:hypothetical protein